MSIRELVNWNRSFGIPVRRKNENWNSLASLQQEMNNFFERLYTGLNVCLTDWDGSDVPAVNVIENGESFTVKAELPGIDPKDIDVEVTDGFLTIRGHRSQEVERKETDGSYIRREISEGFFQRTLSLPETAYCDKADASFKNGVLTISIPKKAEALQKPRKVEIKKAA